MPGLISGGVWTAFEQVEPLGHQELRQGTDGARSEEVAPRTVSLRTFSTGDASFAPRNASILSSFLRDATPAPSLATPRKSNYLAKKAIEPTSVRAIARKAVLKEGADAFPQRVYSGNQPIKECTLTCRKIKRKSGKCGVTLEDDDVHNFLEFLCVPS